MPTVLVDLMLGLMLVTLGLCLEAAWAAAAPVRPVVGRRHVLVSRSLGLEPEGAAFALVRGLFVALGSAVLVSGLPARREGQSAGAAAKVPPIAGGRRRHCALG